MTPRVDPATGIRRTRPLGADFTTWHAPDGWPHRRMVWPQLDRSRVRGKLLFAGGRGDFIEKYLECHAWWHEAGWDVTAFDWRGQGASQGDQPVHLLDFTVMIDDLEALIADWRSGEPGPHVVVAHSMGGHMLLRTLADRRPALDAAVLVAPMLRVNSAPLPPLFAPQLTEFLCMVGWRGAPVWRAPVKPQPPGSARQHFLTGSPERYADELWWWEQEPAFKIGVPQWGWIRAAYRSAAGSFTPDKLGKVETPVLILGTDRDRLVSAAAIRGAAALLPNATLKMYPDAAHEILREADPIRLDALGEIDRFFDEHAR